MHTIAFVLLCDISGTHIGCFIGGLIVIAYADDIILLTPSRHSLQVLISRLEKNVVACFITLRAKLSGAVYCNRYCLWICGCVCLFVCLFVCGSVIRITGNCVHRSSPNWVCIGKGSDHLQLIKF